MKIKESPIQFMEHNKSNSKRKSHSFECPHKESREIIHYQLNSSSDSSRLEKQTNKKTKKTKTDIPKRSRQQEIIKLREEIN